jgi:hypothetical protein
MEPQITQEEIVVNRPVKERVIDFARKHKTKFAVGATLVAAGYVHMYSVKQYEAFLAEKGLTEEYWADEFEEEQLIVE